MCGGSSNQNTYTTCKLHPKQKQVIPTGEATISPACMRIIDEKRKRQRETTNSSNQSTKQRKEQKIKYKLETQKKIDKATRGAVRLQMVFEPSSTAAHPEQKQNDRLLMKEGTRPRSPALRARMYVCMYVLQVASLARNNLRMTSN